MADLMSSDLFSWVILPILIVLARMVDVTLGTIRIIFVSRGSRLAAPILGFFEVFIWIVAISQIMQNLNNPLCYVAYALGFALGNYLGIMAEEKLAIGYLVLRIFVIKENPEKETLMEKLIEAGFGVTAVEGRGATKEVTLLFSLIRRKDLDEAVSIIEQADSKVFYSIESAKAAHAGIFPEKKTRRTPFISNVDIRRKITGGFRKRK
ncbi:DUF2179 domain-containing protein [Thermoclostridium caenicola]|uniref:UPF0316 protein SAMN05444373_100154 n=1 Tax=Thermoclostridium caenicola TaxID=659425 RepID=A0A1M6AJH7_9FIRM|nr:DUF2179 domain-containing protein [Thermoclostridium caenicola]SHI36373.1 Uncharacterized protein YebE, UPF0316 family [Thermoclostridium caenicola]HOL85445.1 DUF2179 domain-containing protein [Thermoclostridium caenicola]HOP72324.1 DUF2179 domain-containing protein [Thermoclostridium caenicola]HPO77831.1 DUF2179 domain-containing protein [Thermoclostridium caenicola]